MENYDIAVDARMIDASGIGVYLQNILPAICERYKVALLGDKNKLKLLDADIKVFDAPIYSIKELFTLPFNIPSCSVFWSPHFNVPIYNAKAKHRVTTIHDTFHLAFYHTLNTKQKLYAKAFYNLAVRRSDSVITVSNYSKEEITKHIADKPGKVKVIYNGVQQETFAKTFSSNEAEHIRTKYKLPDNYILFVGNVKPHKNLANLVSALEQFCKEEKEVKLVIAGKREGFITGDDQLTKILDSNSSLKKHILFTGFVDQEDLPYIYQDADLFVMPSLYEGFGLPPLEAMAANTLAAVSSQTSLPEVCRDGAFYFNPYDSSDISNVISKILNLNQQERKAIRDKARAIANEYTWQKSIQQHIKIFDEYI